MRRREANFPISYTQGTGNQEIKDISLIPRDFEFPGAADQNDAVRKLKSSPRVALPFEVQRCYQPADLPLDALAEVLRLLLEEKPASSSPGATTSTCFQTPAE